MQGRVYPHRAECNPMPSARTLSLDPMRRTYPTEAVRSQELLAARRKVGEALPLTHLPP
jgi:hypothetical protein